MVILVWARGKRVKWLAQGLLMVGATVTPASPEGTGAACVPACVAAHRSPSGASRDLGCRDPDGLAGVLETGARSNLHTVNPHAICRHHCGGARPRTRPWHW